MSPIETRKIHLNRNWLILKSLGPGTVKICQFPGPETDNMCQFLGLEINSIGKRYYIGYTQVWFKSKIDSWNAAILISG
jgi:hypothetical protein